MKIPYTKATVQFIESESWCRVSKREYKNHFKTPQCKM